MVCETLRGRLFVSSSRVPWTVTDFMYSPRRCHPFAGVRQVNHPSELGRGNERPPRGPLRHLLRPTSIPSHRSVSRDPFRMQLPVSDIVYSVVLDIANGTSGSCLMGNYGAHNAVCSRRNTQTRRSFVPLSHRTGWSSRGICRTSCEIPRVSSSTSSCECRAHRRFIPVELTLSLQPRWAAHHGRHIRCHCRGRTRSICSDRAACHGRRRRRAQSTAVAAQPFGYRYVKRLNGSHQSRAEVVFQYRVSRRGWAVRLRFLGCRDGGPTWKT